MENKIIDLTALTEYDTKIKELINNQTLQYDTMPEAGEDNLGQIIQYTGTTTQDYTNGYFYTCVSDGGDPATYSWENVEVQKAEQDPSDINYISLASPVNTEENRQLMTKIINSHIGRTFILSVYNSGKRIEFAGDDMVVFDIKQGVDGYANIMGKPITPLPYSVNSTSSASFRGNWLNGVFTVNEIYYGFTTALTDRKYLSTTNTWGYTPTGDYNPATKKYVDDAIAAIDITDREVVQELPTQDISTKTIYMVPKTTAGTQNAYTEYMYINNAWEKIGDTEIDLTDYVTSSDLSTAVAGVETQYSTMPTASEDNLGQIVQYTGTTDGTYTNGHFYQVVSDGGDPATYSWANINVQDGKAMKVFIYKDPYASFPYQSETTAFWNALTDAMEKDPDSVIVKKITNGDIASVQYSSYNGTRSIQLTFIRPNDTALGGYQILFNQVIKANKRTSDTHWNVTYKLTRPALPVDGDKIVNVASVDYVDSNIPQKSTLPTASSTLEGKIYQYIGTTDSTYTNGYFYKCVSDGEATPTYSWENINTSNSSSGVIINNLNLSDPDMLKALNVEYEQWKNNKAYCVYIEVQQGGLYYTVPVSFVGVSGKTQGVMLQSAYTIYESTTVGSYLTRGIVVDASVNINQEGHIISVSSLRVIEKNISKRQSNDDFILMAQNVAPYTPTSDYNPANKKYVDDLVGDIASVLATLTTVDEEEY